MKLIDDWHWVLNHSWSMRFIVLSIVLTGVEFILPIFMNDPPVPRLMFAFFALAVSILAGISRLIAQRRPVP